MNVRNIRRIIFLNSLSAIRFLTSFLQFKKIYMEIGSYVDQVGLSSAALQCIS